MKARITLVVCAALLSTAVLAGAAEPVAAAPTPQVAPEATMSPVAPQACTASLSSLSLPGLAPQAIPLVARADCGACSKSGCQNTPIGTGCYIGGTNGTCQNVYGNICTGGGGINDCQCWNGPLP